MSVYYENITLNIMIIIILLLLIVMVLKVNYIIMLRFIRLTIFVKITVKQKLFAGFMEILQTEKYYASYSDVCISVNTLLFICFCFPQPDLFPGWVRGFVVDDTKQREHFHRMSTHVQLNDDKTRRHLGGHVTSEGGGPGANVASRGFCVVDFVTDEWRRRADKLQSAGLTREHLTGLPVEFLSAGSETSSATLLWLLLLMALHEDIQVRMLAQITIMRMRCRTRLVRLCWKQLTTLLTDHLLRQFRISPTSS